MAHHAQDERHALADLFLDVGPEAPTCCEGWTAADLAAHLVVRDRRPDAAAGLVIPAARGYTARVQQSIRDGHAWPELVEMVRSGPPLPLRPLDESINTVEYFVHHEDVRRAQAGWMPRTLGRDLEEALWNRLRRMARFMMSKAPTGVVLDAAGFGQARRSGPSEVTVSGLPGELVLFATGRGRVAKIDMSGDDMSIERLRHAKLGF